MSAAPRLRMSVEQYLVWDRDHEGRHEHVNGETWAMAGAEPAHNLVCANLTGALIARLRGSGCRVYTADQRVLVDETGLYCYPDLTVVCGPPETLATTPRTITNPRVLVEVLSPSTASFDKDVKFAHYRRRASVAAVLFVSLPERRLERYARTPAGWLLTEAGGDGVLAVPELGVELPLAEVYDGVDEALAAERE